jgi:hypothetical protein
LKGRNGRDDAERLANHHFVNPSGNVLEVVSLHERWNAAGNLYVLD